MRNWLVIANEKVLKVIQKDGTFMLHDYEGYYDTITEDPSGKFIEGDVYTINKWEEYNVPTEEMEARKLTSNVTKVQEL